MSNDVNIPGFSEAEIKRYLAGQMSPEESHRMESAMLEDPFLEAAVDGYASAGPTLSTAGLDQQWQDALKDNGRLEGGWSLKGPLLLAGAVVTGLMVFWTMDKQEQVSLYAEEVQESIEQTEVLRSAYEDSLEIMEIDLAQVVEEAKEIIPSSTREDQQEIEQFGQAAAVITPSEVDRTSAPAELSPRGVDSAQSSQERGLDIPEPKVFYLHDLKLADHREDYPERFFMSAEVLTGTEAVYEAQENELHQMGEIISEDYEGIMSAALAQYVLRDYKGALRLFRRVSAVYPNDVNVAFYGGLCYYNLGRWERAERRFRRSMSDPGRVFDQESAWYLALTLHESGQSMAARSILDQIVEKDGFYAEKARALLGI